jgi:Ribonuclease G/E
MSQEGRIREIVGEIMTDRSILHIIIEVTGTIGATDIIIRREGEAIPHLRIVHPTLNRVMIDKIARRTPESVIENIKGGMILLQAQGVAVWEVDD